MIYSPIRIVSDYMHTYISFLRGVNMTGHNSIKMTELAALYSDLGFIRPETFIQSGNVIFSTDKGDAGSLTLLWQ